MEKLGIQPLSLIAQVVNFLILLFLLSKFLYKPILKVLDERKRKIQQGLERAKQMEEERAKFEAVQAEKVEKTKQATAALIQEAEKTAQEMKRKAVEEAEKEAMEIKKQARIDLEEERERIIAEVRKQAAWLVLTTTKQVLKESLSEKRQRELIKEVLKEMGEVKSVTR